MWASTYIQSISSTHNNSGQTLLHLFKAIVDNFATLKPLFEEELFTNNKSFSNYQEQGFRTMEEKICWMLFVDGCALLHILQHAKLDPRHEMNIKIDQLVLVMLDVLLLENQLPFALLKLLWRKEEKELIEAMKEFLKCHHWATDDGNNYVKIEIKTPPTHLLDLQRSIILYRDNNNKKNETPNYFTLPTELWDWLVHKMKRLAQLCTRKSDLTQTDPIAQPDPMVTYRNIMELKEAGIYLSSTKTRRPADISFSYGWICSELKLPEIIVDDTTAATVLNLIAYEMCPDFENDYGICSYVSFLDSLIDHPNDVKALRSKQILLNSLGSDEEVATLFNTLSTDLVPDMRIYKNVRAKIEKHYSDKGRTWLALLYHTYFSNPWAIIAFHAAVVVLALAFIQTWYAINPPK
ncbi:hypothetical protein VNO78_33207 [Psophocarpus tetragonolobus]|uniref:Uncharacterized protein n=1 Tax=Psophocarpus tetragonolobus TaxID=3891 RepID=A0AAN9P0P7_PSOTE